MKTKRENVKRKKSSFYDENDEKKGIKKVKKSSGKSKKISIYDDLDDDLDLDILNYSGNVTVFEDDYYF